MSTPISPLEQLEQQTSGQQQQPTQSAPQPSAPSAPAISPLEQLEQQTSQPTAQAAPQSQDAGFLSGLYNTTIKPVGSLLSTDANYAKTIYNEAGNHLANGDYLKAAGSLLSVIGGDDRNPLIQTLNGILAAHKEQIKATAASAKAGNYSEAAGHGLAAALPVLGPAAAQAGEDIGAGKTGQGLGEAAGTVGAVLAPEAIGKVGDAIKAAPEALSTAADIASHPVEAASKIVGGTKALFTEIPADVESKLVSTVGDAAEDAGLERPTASTLKESVADLGDKFKQRAQAVYQQLDEEAPGFQELKDKTQQLQKAYKTQLNLDPAKADEIGGELKTAQQNMSELLDDGQQARWKAADQDWSRFKALQKVGTKTAGAAEDLTDPALTNVDKLHTAVKGLTNSTRGGNPIDLLSKAFGDHAEDIRSIVQDGTGITSNAQAAKAFWTWAGKGTAKAAGVAGLGSAGYLVTKALSGKH